MDIKLIESERQFSEGNIEELERFLSKLPTSHLNFLNHIERVSSLEDALASFTFTANGGEIRLPDDFYSIDDRQREFIFLHELGHNYFDLKDENEGDRSMLKMRSCEKENVASLLRVQWMELGLWNLDVEKWNKLKTMFHNNEAYRNKYTYLVAYQDPNFCLGEWKCPASAMIPTNSSKDGFRYNEPFYSPIEEMADAYALFVLERDYFLKYAQSNEVIKAKFNFIEKQFNKNDHSEPIKFLKIKKDKQLNNSIIHLY